VTSEEKDVCGKRNAAVGQVTPRQIYVFNIFCRVDERARDEKGICASSLGLIIAWHYSLGFLRPTFRLVLPALAAARKRFILRALFARRVHCAARATTKARKEAMKVNLNAESG
jgi:hypothetical protein